MNLRPDLLATYGTAAVPRYTSYPSANLWTPADETFAMKAFKRAGTQPLSLYVHVPFCEKLCFYCGCNMMVNHSDQRVERYLRAIEIEAEYVSKQINGRPKVVQLHLGGGTPTHLDEAQLERLVAALRKHYDFADELEASIEIHPPVTTDGQLRTLRKLGFNRLSMGVQDFDPEVQQRINRPQPFEQTAHLIQLARELGFQSVNVDLMYGLPLQTPERFQFTLDKVKQLRPDRIALFGYAHMPTLKKHHRMLEEDRPDVPLRLKILERAIDELTHAGYRAIGLDHFALESDELCKARDEGTLRRNFMGYTTCAATDVIALGPSAISEVGGAFVQNARGVYEWALALESGHHATERGWDPTRDDDLRRDLIQRLFCRLDLDTSELAREHHVDFEQTFATELKDLERLEKDGLVRKEPGHIRITPEGQLLLRNVAAVFDRYFREAKAKPKHSTAV